MQFGRPLPFSASVGATATLVKGAPCRLYGWQIVNNTAALAYCQVFNKATAGAVTVGTTVPDYVIPLPASGGAVMPFGEIGMEYSAGIVIACTTGRTNSVGAACDVLMGVK